MPTRLGQSAFTQGSERLFDPADALGFVPSRSDSAPGQESAVDGCSHAGAMRIASFIPNLHVARTNPNLHRCTRHGRNGIQAWSALQSTARMNLDKTDVQKNDRRNRLLLPHYLFMALRGPQNPLGNRRANDTTNPEFSSRQKPRRIFFTAAFRLS